MAEYRKSERLFQRDRDSISSFLHVTDYPFTVKKAKGSVIVDEDGNRYIDFLSSASSLNLGSRSSVVLRAIRKQLRKTTQYSMVYAYNEPAAAYAEALASVYPGQIPVKVCYGNCGSDCNDAAIKIARAYTGRKNIVVFRNGYYGSTYGAVSLTSWSSDLFEAIGPKLPGVFTLPFYAEGTYAAADPDERKRQLEAEFAAAVSPDEAAAVIIEPVQGDGGIVSADPLFLRHLYEICREHGILFISEEVQHGFFRTGNCFAIERFGIVPDGIVVGKSAGAGLVLGAFIGRREMMDVLARMAHTFTLAGNHLSCAAGLAQLNYMKSDRFQNRLRENIRQMEEELSLLREKHPETVRGVRQIGFSVGIDIAGQDGLTLKECTRELVYRCYRNGLILTTNLDGVLRIQPPLTIRRREMKKGFQILDRVLSGYENTVWKKEDLYAPVR